MMDQIQLNRDCAVIAVPSGQRETLPAGTAVRIMQSRGGSFTVTTERYAVYRIDGADADALGLAPPGGMAAQPHPQGPLTEEMVWETLKTVYDPEIPVNVVDLGLIYSCQIRPHEEGGKTIAVRMGLTSPTCGMSNVLKADVETRLLRLPEVKEAQVEVAFDPPWDRNRMSEAARLQLGLDLDDTRQPGYVRIS
ncbi:MAG: putative Fe-S cluster assembly protein SufT [Acidobacterium ailaaui]|nr:putative Fe-S cluster assembly protein SufT [Pseudacidobacterium ailaaui]MCL6463493.1 putative Fe-S cluster assembly protein SufT [Pseudacidobacterium ailaaui]